MKEKVEKIENKTATWWLSRIILDFELQINRSAIHGFRIGFMDFDGKMNISIAVNDSVGSNRLETFLQLAELN